MKFILLVVLFVLLGCYDQGNNKESISVNAGIKNETTPDFSAITCQGVFDLHRHSFPYECVNECPPPYAKTPSFVSGGLFEKLSIKKEEIDNWFFIENVPKSLIVSQEYFKGENSEVSGKINYCNESELIYNLLAYGDMYRSDYIRHLKGHAETIAFDALDKHNIYQIIRLGGEDKPEQFFENLLNTPSLAGDYGCDVKQQKVAYGIIEMAHCTLYQPMTAITLYNPSLALVQDSQR